MNEINWTSANIVAKEDIPAGKSFRIEFDDEGIWAYNVDPSTATQIFGILNTTVSEGQIIAPWMVLTQGQAGFPGYPAVFKDGKRIL